LVAELSKECMAISETKYFEKISATRNPLEKSLTARAGGGGVRDSNIF